MDPANPSRRSMIAACAPPCPPPTIRASMSAICRFRLAIMIAMRSAFLAFAASRLTEPAASAALGRADVLEIEILVVDAALRRRDPVCKLADLGDRGHQRADVGTVAIVRKPSRQFSGRSGPPIDAVVQVRPHTDPTVEPL